MSTGYGLLDAYLQQKNNGFQAPSTPAAGLLSTQAYQPSQTPGSSTSRYQAPDAIGAEYSGVPTAPGTANGFGNFALGLAIPGYNLARIAGDVLGIDALKNPLNALAEATGLDSLRSNSSYNVSNPICRSTTTAASIPRRWPASPRRAKAAGTTEATRVAATAAIAATAAATRAAGTRMAG